MGLNIVTAIITTIIGIIAGFIILAEYIKNTFYPVEEVQALISEGQLKCVYVNSEIESINLTTNTVLCKNGIKRNDNSKN